MALSDKFKSNKQAVAQGVWIRFEDLPNEDGTIPAFHIYPRTNRNKAYDLEYSEVWKDFIDKKTGDVDLSKAPDDVINIGEGRLFANHVCDNWVNFWPDGKTPLPYSREACQTIFSDTDWEALRNQLNLKALAVETFNDKAILELDAKNSVTSLATILPPPL